MKHPGYRPRHPERKLLSLQDWYGLGALTALIGEPPEGRGVCYCGKRAAGEQYEMGYRHAAELLQTEGEQPCDTDTREPASS